jgi:hypothetical protein
LKICIVEPPVWDRTTTYQTHYDALGRTAQTQFARQHNSMRQFFHLLGKILLRWVVSFLLSVMMVVAFYEYEKVKILDKTAKRWFNALSTGLYLTLGLNLAASLKGMAIILRWKLLSRKKHNLEEVCLKHKASFFSRPDNLTIEQVDYILGLSSLIKVSRYGLYTVKKRPLTTITCICWVLFNAVNNPC